MQVQIGIRFDVGMYYNVGCTYMIHLYKTIWRINLLTFVMRFNIR